MRILYSILLYLLTPFIVLRLIWRSRRAPDYRRRIHERFAHIESPTQQVIWVHAVSVGEVILAIPLIKKLKQAYPDFAIVITSTTPTGSQQIKKHFVNMKTQDIFHIYAPYDLPHVVERFLKIIKPKMAIMMETELWPNIFYYCQRKKIPLFVANARLSQRSYQRYARFLYLVKPMLNNVTQIIAQTQDDADRYLRLGVDKNKITVSGSMKFDLQLPASLCESAEILRQQWGVDRPIWIAASTHDGEEEIILRAFALVKKALPTTLLVLVPRHPERFNKVAHLAEREGYEVVLRSSGERCNKNTAVFLGDTMGELMLFYAASDLAFVGGSFVEVGGHNLLEPAAIGIPMLTGPFMFNFTEITRLLVDVAAAKQVHSEIELANEVIYLLQNTEKRVQIGEKGKHVVEKNRGALDKHLAIIQAAVNL
ncbi:MAG: lipid IV(A) 3-deoxy-D-manno-octulosonic acid transferase [Legionellales bacterium]|nr:lipid IV(A) 3-deoxy-D-manno-octulosonic acid transferase [Legionellales bacterium]